MPRDDRHTRPPAGLRGAGGNAVEWSEDNLGEVLFEFRPIGTYMRVNVVHPATHHETFVLGPRNASQGDLKMLALRKLKTELNKHR